MLKFFLFALVALNANAEIRNVDGVVHMIVDDKSFPLEMAELTPEAEARLGSRLVGEEVAIYRSTLSPQRRDLKARMSTVKDQGARSSCSAFAAIGLAEAFLGGGADLSEQCLVHLSSGVDSGDFFSRLEFIADNGLHGEGYCPYVDPSDYPEWARADADTRAALMRKALKTVPDDLSRRATTPIRAQVSALRLEDLETGALINYVRNKIKDGQPVGVSVYVAGKNWDNGVIETIPTDDELKLSCPQKPRSLTNPAAASGKKCATHGLVITGFDDIRGVFYFKNSWSKRWGVNDDYEAEKSASKRTGYGVMSYEYYAKFGFGRLLTLEQ